MGNRGRGEETGVVSVTTLPVRARRGKWLKTMIKGEKGIG
jgi:hypothetical protein